MGVTSVVKNPPVEATPQVKKTLNDIDTDILKLTDDMNAQLTNIYARQSTVQAAITNAISAQTTSINAKLDTLAALLEDIKTNTTPTP